MVENLVKCDLNHSLFNHNYYKMMVANLLLMIMIFLGNISFK